MAFLQQNLFEQEQHQVTHLEDSKIKFKIRSNKRISRSRLVVSPEEGLVVEMPRKPSIRRAKKLIHLRKSWVLNALESIDEKRERARTIKQKENSILIFGQEKELLIKTAQLKSFILETKNCIYVGITEKYIRKESVYKTLNDWLRSKATSYLPMRLRQINRSRFKCTGVVIKDQKTIWGSCSTEGVINLNWRLIMAPKEHIDYIIIHELCHTRYLNHSKAYWSLVENIFPDYEESEEWFRHYGFLLDTKQAKLTLA